MSSKDRIIIDEIKDRLDLVKVIGETISLKRESDGMYTGATSSSSKSGTSLKVDSNLQLYKNFASGDGGDVFNWIAYVNGLDVTRDFPSVLRIAADMAGVELHEMTESERGHAKEKADIRDLLTQAAEIYHKNLTDTHYKFILEKWGIKKETVDQFKIGYAKVGRNLKELTGETLYKSGLVYVNNGTIPSGEFFQGRIIFPYWKNGKVVYFIGRETDETPERELFKGAKYKKQLHHSEKFPYISEAVQNAYFYGEDSLMGNDYCIITEGVTDCIAMLQAGFPCISPVTVQFRRADHEKLIQLCKRLETVYICNDNEDNSTGLKGALETAEALEKGGIEAKIIILPKPEGTDKIDIADFMKNNSADDFKELMSSSRRLWDFKLDIVKIPETAGSLERGKLYKRFIKNELNGMQSLEWRVLAENEAADKFKLNKKDARPYIDDVLKTLELENAANEAKEQNAISEGKETDDPLAKYPKWVVTKANQILNRGDAFKFILRVWQKRHVGDTNIGENCICSSITRQILNSRRGLHIKPSGKSGKGKSDSIESFADLLPDGVLIQGSISAKALFYDPDLKPGTIVYCDDVGFPEDVVSTIKQSTSNFQSETSHRTIVNGEFKKYRIPPRVTFWFSAVAGIEDEQLANRFLQADVDEGTNQDKLVNKHQKDVECLVESDETAPNALICKCILEILYQDFYRVKIPFANAITWHNTENRRNFDKFKDIIRAVTVFRVRQREKFHGYILATVDDFYRALDIYRGTSVSNATNLTKAEMEYLKYFIAARENFVTQKMLVKHFGNSVHSVRHMLNGRNGKGGLLSKIPELIEIDETTSNKKGDESTSTREKKYQYIGAVSTFDTFERAAEINLDDVDRVTLDFKASLVENIAKVTKGDGGVTPQMVTHGNSISIINNNNNNSMGDEISGREREVFSSHAFEEKIVKNDVCIFPLSHSEENGHPSSISSQLIPENRKNPLVTPTSPLLKNGGGGGGEGVTPLQEPLLTSESLDGDVLNEGDQICHPSKDGPIQEVIHLLKHALSKYATEHYHRTVPDIEQFVKAFNDMQPSYLNRLGEKIILEEARRLSKWGWRC